MILRTAIKPLLITAASIFAVGCEPVADSNGAQLQRELADLKKTMASQARALATQSSDIGFLKLQMEWIQNKTILVDVSAQAYQCIDTNTGKFLISCDNVQPYADGQKLTFRIGNPNFVTF